MRGQTAPVSALALLGGFDWVGMAGLEIARDQQYLQACCIRTETNSCHLAMRAPLCLQASRWPRTLMPRSWPPLYLTSGRTAGTWWLATSCATACTRQ